MTIFRASGVGAFDNNPMIDPTGAGALTFTRALSASTTSATLRNPPLWNQPTGIYQLTFSSNEVRAVALTRGASTCTWTGGLSNGATANAILPFEVILSDTQSYEYRWIGVGKDVRLVKPTLGVTARYKNHRLSQTATDPNIYYLNTQPTENLLERTTFDRFGYTGTGWVLTVNSGIATMTATTLAGPAGYNSAQITLAATAGSALATYGNGTSAATLRTSAMIVRPGETYWGSAHCNMTTGANTTFIANIYNLSGAHVATVTVASNTGAITSGIWNFIEGPIAIPATGAYMSIGVAAVNSTILVTDLRLRRAS
jgi:hypothetical protein